MSNLGTRNSEPIQRTIDEHLQALEGVYRETNDYLLRKVFHEISLLIDVEFTYDTDPEDGHAKRKDPGNTAAHRINLDPKTTDPETKQSLILHELIQVSADRKYKVNQTGEKEPAITAVVDPNVSEEERIKHIRTQARYRYDLAIHLASIINSDWGVYEKAAELVRTPVVRIQSTSFREFDSIVGEL